MALLELQGVAKHFGAIEALRGVDLSIEPGEVPITPEALRVKEF